jgi:KDO2-lipid IV(A) lauroyltransferase
MPAVTESAPERAPAPTASAARQPRPERPLQRVRRAVLSRIARVGIGIMGALPLAIGSRLGAFLGGLGYWLSPKEAARAVAHLAIAFPDQPAHWHRAVAKQMFRHVGAITAEFIRVIRWPADSDKRMAMCVNWREYHAQLQADKEAGPGLVAVVTHLGSWEMLGAVAVKQGPVTVVAKAPNDPRMARLADELRAKCGVQVVYQDESPRRLFRALRNKEMLGILPDQDIRRLPGIFSPFFGKLAHTVTAPVTIAQSTRAVLRPYALIREGRRYRAVWGDRIDPGTKGDAEALHRATREWTAWLEATIRKHPEQYMWMHRRWKTRPPEESAETGEKT